MKKVATTLQIGLICLVSAVLSLSLIFTDAVKGQTIGPAEFELCGGRGYIVKRSSLFCGFESIILHGTGIFYFQYTRPIDENGNAAGQCQRHEHFVKCCIPAQCEILRLQHNELLRVQ